MVDDTNTPSEEQVGEVGTPPEGTGTEPVEEGNVDPDMPSEPAEPTE